MQHIIKQQRIHLSVDKKMDAFHIQQRMSELYRQEVLPLLDTLFDEAVNEDKTLYIGSLIIDLGVMTEKELNSKRGLETFILKIAEKCKERLAKEASTPQPSHQTETSIPGIFRQWMFYMQKGYLPWNVLQLTPVWKQNVLEALAVGHTSVDVLRQLIKSNPQAVIRIVEQHAESFLLQLVAIMAAVKHTELSGILNELEMVLNNLGLQRTAAGSLSKPKLRKQLWYRILSLAAEFNERLSSNLIGETILQEYLGQPAKLQKLKPDVLRKLKVLIPVIRSWSEKAAGNKPGPDKGPARLSEKPGAMPEMPKPSAEPQEKKNPIEKRGTDFSADEEAQMWKKTEAFAQEQPLPSFPPGELVENKSDTATGQKKTIADIDEDGIFVVNAGIVLLHPFLSLFFNRLALPQEKNFLDKASHQKALYLLHYLATGVREAEECELVVPKILTAYPLEEPVEKAVFLSQGETAEADHLLQEVIRQWEVLKSSSADALREGFLQRRAKLFTKNDSLYLQFETEAIDILLDYLPWNLSIIKLPWMKDMIRVEWR